MALEGILRPVKTIRWNDFFEITEDKIIHYKIIPDKTVKNDSVVLARAMHELYSAPRDRLTIDIKGMKITYRVKDKTFFDIILRPSEACFYLSVHKRWSSFMLMKMQSIWDKCAIEEVDRAALNDFDPAKCLACDMKLSRHNMFSLKTSTKDLDPLNGMFAVLRDLAENDRLRVSFVFDSMDRLDWQQAAEEAYKDYKSGTMPRRRAVSKDDVLQHFINAVEAIFTLYIEIRLMIIESILGIVGGPDEKEDAVDKAVDALEQNRDKEIQQIKAHGGVAGDTIRKLKAASFYTAIRILSQSDKAENRLVNLRTVANAFKDLTLDNELHMVELSEKKLQKKIQDIFNFKEGARMDRDILSDEEVGKMIQLPQITLQQQYKLKTIDTREIALPKELQTGKIPIGAASYKNKLFRATWPADSNLRAMPKIIIGPQNSGKTTYSINYSKGAYKAGDATIMLDYVQNCEMSCEAQKHVADKDKVIIDVSDQTKLFALSYPEVSGIITPDTSAWDRQKVANILASQVEYMINSITTQATGELTAPMLRFLYAASMTVFVNPDTTINDVFDVLRYGDIREDFINRSRELKVFENDEEILRDLEELNDPIKNKSHPGTREALILGVTNRIIELKKNIYVKAMLKAPIDSSINFIKFIEEGKQVFIQIPQTVFIDPRIRDVLATYFWGRIWLAAQFRKQDKNTRLCNIIMDEVHQVPTCGEFIKNHLTEFRRHRLSAVFTVHYLKQFRNLLETVKSAGASYMLLAGTEKENLRMLEEELQPFTIEEGLELKPWHSLNVINYGNQYARFISKLP